VRCIAVTRHLPSDQLGAALRRRAASYYSRESRYDNSRSAQYCSREVVGYEYLDDYGDWQSNQQYGHVWFPRVSAGWVPYQQGHWTWIDPWGWTWILATMWGVPSRTSRSLRPLLPRQPPICRAPGCLRNDCQTALSSLLPSRLMQEAWLAPLLEEGASVNRRQAIRF
jgi:uncharacterized protein DUF6600